MGTLWSNCFQLPGFLNGIVGRWGFQMEEYAQPLL